MTVEKKNIKDAFLLCIITGLAFVITPNILLLFNIRSKFIIVTSLIIILTICLAFLKRLYLIKNSLLLENDEKKIPFIIAIVVFMGGFIFLLERNFAPTSFDELLFIGVNSLAEEFYFRVAILGILIEGFSFVLDKYNIYWTKKGENISVLILFILLSSIFFAFLHNDWSKFVIRFIHGILFSFLFIATNKKIYAPWFVHYIINMSVPIEMN